MSATLKWEPSKRKSKSLPDALKFVLRDKGGVTNERTIFGRGNISYLRGLADAGVEGAQELIDAIDKHEEVELWLEY